MSDYINQLRKETDNQQQLFPYILPIQGSRHFRTALGLAGLVDSEDYETHPIASMPREEFVRNNLDKSGYAEDQLMLCELWWLPIEKASFQRIWDGAMKDPDVQAAIDRENDSATRSIYSETETMPTNLTTAYD